MALSTWSVFRGNVNDTLVRELADAMVTLGLRDSGYEYLLVDAGWATNVDGCDECLPNRDQQGHLVVDTIKFPNITETIDYVHSKGLSFGLWFGVEMCQETNDRMAKIKTPLDPPESTVRTLSTITTKTDDVDYATIDAQFFASIGVDAIKHDNCIEFVANTTQGLSQNFEKYARMSAALNKTGRPMLYDVTLQVNKERAVPAYDYNYIWSPEPYGQDNVQRIANTWWSMPLNKYNCWSCCVHPNEFIVPDEKCQSPTALAAWRGLLPTLDIQDMGTPGWKGHMDWGGRGKGWNHLDQLGICVGSSWYGPGLTQLEQQAQVSLWAILASPMIISVDVRNMTIHDDCYSLIANPRVIAVHQDALGQPGRRLKNYYRLESSAIIDTQLWGRQLLGGSVAVVFFNREETKRDISASFEDMGLSRSVRSVSVAEVWTGTSRTGVSSPVTALSVPPHGVAFLVVTPEEGKKLDVD